MVDYKVIIKEHPNHKFSLYKVWLKNHLEDVKIENTIWDVSTWSKNRAVIFINTISTSILESFIGGVPIMKLDLDTITNKWHYDLDSYKISNTNDISFCVRELQSLMNNKDLLKKHIEKNKKSIKKYIVMN